MLYNLYCMQIPMRFQIYFLLNAGKPDYGIFHLFVLCIQFEYHLVLIYKYYSTLPKVEWQNTKMQ